MIYLDKKHVQKKFEVTPMSERYNIDDVNERLYNNKDITEVFEGKQRKPYQFKKR